MEAGSGMRASFECLRMAFFDEFRLPSMSLRGVRQDDVAINVHPNATTASADTPRPPTMPVPS